MCVNIIGAGLAGCECAIYLASRGIKVKLYEMKKIKKTPAQNSDNFSELVCSNSLKAEEITNACGLLKAEMELLGSNFIEKAYLSKVPAGKALAVDRDIFSSLITEDIKNNKNIEVIDKEIEDLSEFNSDDIVVVAAGPLCSEKLMNSIKKYLGDDGMYFYDAEAPIISSDSIDMNKAYFLDRYSDTEGGDYLNLPMTKDEYYAFYNELINAKSAERHEFDKLVLFEGCMPIEEMAKRGEKTLTFGMLKPVGLDNPKTHEKYYAVVQLRSENKEKTMYNMVGFQTSLAFPEQKRVFSMIPGLENAEFLRYGVMHRNSYINGGKYLNNDFSLKKNSNIYFAGQISGVEGYVESAASGLVVAINILNKINGKESIDFGSETMLGSLSNYVSTESKNFQPMNANFGILKPLDERIKDKKLRYEKQATIALGKIHEIKEKYDLE